MQQDLEREKKKNRDDLYNEDYDRGKVCISNYKYTIIVNY